MSATSGSGAIEKFLNAIQTATIPDCDAWSADATLDATVPNWRLHASHAGMVAVWMAVRNLSIAGAADGDITAS